MTPMIASKKASNTKYRLLFIHANTEKSFLKGLMILNNKILRILQQQTLRSRTHAVELYTRRMAIANKTCVSGKN